MHDGFYLRMRKYAGQTVAVRTVQEAQDVLKWMLTDHLGSASVTANENGTWNSTIQYTAFGEVRAKNGVTPGDYRYTGQLEQAELGLYYYVARWYDPAIAHFAQADTIISIQQVKSMDRYHYTGNNPLRFVDPSGHYYCEGDSNCKYTKYHRYERVMVGVLKDDYNVGLDGEMAQWTNYRVQAVYEGVKAVGEKLSETIPGDGDSAFKKTYKNGVTFIWGTEGIPDSCKNIGLGGCTATPTRIFFTSLWAPTLYRSYEGALIMARNNVVHELGHAFGQLWYNNKGDYDPTGPYVNIPDSLRPEVGWIELPEPYKMTWRQHPDDPSGSEVFADMFLGWTFNTYKEDIAGEERRKFMENNMASWVDWAQNR